MGTYEKITGFADEMTPDLTGQIEGLQKLGMHYVEMRGVDGDNLIYHTDEKVKEIKKRLDDAGIRLSALGSPLGKIGITDDFAPHFEAFKRACEIAHRMETRNIRMFSFYMPDEKPETLVKNREEVMDRLGRFADYAKQADVVLLHENEKGIYGEMAKECLDLMQTLGSDHFKAIFDFANFVQAKQDTLEAYEMLKDYIVYIHVKDALWENGKVVPAGYGDGHVKEILGKLFANGFDGFLSLEPHLFNFTGLQELEKDSARTKVETDQPLSGFECFSLAHASLLKLGLF